MKTARLTILFLSQMLCSGFAQSPLHVHDPSTIITEQGQRRFLSTGVGLSLMREQERDRWTRESSIFSAGAMPAWHAREVPENKGNLWAPDIIKRGSLYYVYYSVSSFGKKRSAIGLVTGKTLDPQSKTWHWQDRGPVITSDQKDRYNAIDPAIYAEASGDQLWMTYGSFWDGIFLVELDPKSGLRKEPKKAPLHLAHAPEIEAAFLCKHQAYYYLFVNWGKCCRGIDSTYEIRVGRSSKITGPYLDDAGVDMRKGGGTLVIDSVGDYVGPGHASIFTKDGKEFLAHHYYDRRLRGDSRLRLLPLTWNKLQWPVVLDEVVKDKDTERRKH